MKIQCKIISVNVDEEQDFNSVQDFGHVIEDGKKLRYVIRRNYINNFILEKELPEFDFQIYDAVTPNKFTHKGTEVNFGNEILITNENSDFYIANILSHYEIWKINEDTLIFEDDVELNSEILTHINDLIESFKSIEDPNKILYLQLSTPWHETFFEKKFQLRPISDKIGEYLSGDLSGTSAMFLTKEAKKIILDNILPLCACDKYFNNLVNKKIIKYYLPLNSEHMIKLNKNTSWI
jgi:GR25 family glycosyltransferase involved in LPS biosynthesis